MVLLLFASCSSQPPPAEAALPTVLPLQFEFDASDIEFSSLCWWGDELIILPQYPTVDGGGVLALHRDSIARAIGDLEAGRAVRPLRPKLLRTHAHEIPSRIRAYDGLEALAIGDGRCFALAEFGDDAAPWGSWLVAGAVERDAGVVEFERMADKTLAGPQVRENFTHEALVLTGTELWVICELNGRSVTSRPMAARFTRDLEELPPLVMPPLEYRITDATELDAQDRFWVCNLFWPPDAEVIRPEIDDGPVERLVPLRRVGDQIVRDPDLPVLDLRAGGDHPMHNWEGVARWGEVGFLLVTDSYPENLLAYVALPD